MAAIEQEANVYGWQRIGSGEYGSRDGRWLAHGGQVTGDYDGWWLAERLDGDLAYVESFDTLRDLKRWVAEQEMREDEARAFNDGLRYAMEHDQVESGIGTIYRLRLRDNQRNNDTVAEVFVRGGIVGIEPMRDLDADATQALSTMLASAAGLAELQGGE